VIQKKLRIVIDGNTYIVNTDEDEFKVTRTAELVDQRIRSIRKQTPQLSGIMVSVLAAMQIAHECEHQNTRESALEIEGLRETVLAQRVEIDALRNHREALEEELKALKSQRQAVEEELAAVKLEKSVVSEAVSDFKQEATSTGESFDGQLGFEDYGEKASLKEMAVLLEEANEKIFYLQRRMTDKEEALQAAKLELETFINEFENR